MHEVTLEDARTRAAGLLDEAVGGEEIIIVQAEMPVAKMVPVEAPARRSLYGIDKGRIWMSDDFDAPLDDFAEYM